MHFTYAPFDPASDLEQGDLLERTSDLEAVLAEVHPHFAREYYKHFIVLTQACDLVRRDGSDVGGANYIEVAAIRPLSLVLEREASKHSRSSVLLQKTGAIDSRVRQPLKNFVERLLNNNNHEFFFLQEDAEIGFVESGCAFLRVSIALKADLHYARLQAARIARLSTSFQAKLGWLVGNIYSRVGTEDWVPTHKTKDQWKVLVDRLLDESLVWVDSEKLKAAQKGIDPEVLANMTPEEARAHVSGAVVPKKKDQVIEAVVQSLRAKGLLSDDQAADTARKNLVNDPVLANLVR